MNIRFELPTRNRKNEAIALIEEFEQYHSEIHGSGGLDTSDYDGWLVRTNASHKGNESREDHVPASTFFAIDTTTSRIVGMVNIRHYLNEYLKTSGSGHVGYSVRPTERRKGYATEMLKQALAYLKSEKGVTEALVGCYEDNIASKKTILKYGGVLDQRIVEEDGKVTLAFKIIIP